MSQMKKAILPGTFSIVARDKATGDFGAAASTCVPCVGALCPQVSLQGAICSQAYVNVDLGLGVIQLLELDINVSSAVSTLLAQDPGKEKRQIIGIDARGGRTAHTGGKCLDWHGHLEKPDHVVAGNNLVSENTLQAMSQAFVKSEGQEFTRRLIHVLDAGKKSGGDKDGTQSAAVLVASRTPKFFHNLRVDFHEDPISEIFRTYEAAVEAGRQLDEMYQGAIVIRPSFWRLVKAGAG